MIFKTFFLIALTIFVSADAFVLYNRNFDNSGCNNQNISHPVTLTSPYYPSYYPVSTSCIYSINAPMGSRIVLTFGTIQTEDCCDYIEVFDGPTISSRRLDRFSGVIPANQKSYRSTGNSLTFRFYSDLTVTYKGFSANFAFL